MRTQFTIPNVPLNPNGFPSCFVDANRLDWSSFFWGRYGSGGNYNAHHLFVDDWRIEFLWRHQGEGLAKVSLFPGPLTSPDFTIDRSFPLPVATYQVFRTACLSAFWSLSGCVVVPVLQWGSPGTFSLSSMWIKEGSVVAVRGPQKGTEKEWIFAFEEVLSFCKPSLVLHFGRKTFTSGISTIFIPLHGGRKSLRTE